MTAHEEHQADNAAPSSASADRPDSLATELKKAREAKGYGLSDLHRLTGFSRNTLHQYEAGSRKPGSKELVKLCEVLEVSPNRLLFGMEDPFGETGGILRPLARLSKTDPHRALGLSLMMLPMMASLLSAIGGETMEAIATIADEALRAREPETYRQLSQLMRALAKEDLKALAALPKDAQTQRMAELMQSSKPPQSS